MHFQDFCNAGAIDEDSGHVQNFNPDLVEVAPESGGQILIIDEYLSNKSTFSLLSFHWHIDFLNY